MSFWGVLDYCDLDYLVVILVACCFIRGCSYVFFVTVLMCLLRRVGYVACCKCVGCFGFGVWFFRAILMFCGFGYLALFGWAFVGCVGLLAGDRLLGVGVWK